ncbi:MAG: hypothetical protein QOE71_2805 [Pseudonocardiales bacterium]|nr:hypothetical protein [Pseudonocardiales bacterium]
MSGPRDTSDSTVAGTTAAVLDRQSADAPLVRCEGVGRTYGTGPLAVVAAYDITCEVPRSARIALTGPSGSGKSTLLHMLAGLEPPTVGRLSWPGLGGHPIDRPGRTGVIFQGPSLLPALSVIENVTLPLLLGEVDDTVARSRAQDALGRVGLADLSAALPEQLSGGQAQRVAVARVLASAPALILADEPTGQLDHVAASAVIDVLLLASAELDAALVVATHDPLIAERLTELWRMHDGTLRNQAARATLDGGRA